MLKKKILYSFIILLFLCCKGLQRKSEDFVIVEPFDVEKILSKGMLDVSTLYTTTDYYIYKGITRGFHYELAKDFANFLGVRLNITNVDSDSKHATEGLLAGKSDVLAISLSKTPEREGKIGFTSPFFSTGRVLVQNRQKPAVQTVEELEGKTVYIVKNSAQKSVLMKLRDSLQINFKITEVEQFSMEDLLHLVEIGEIDFTATDENVAKAAGLSMKQLDYSVRLSDDVPVSWATRPNSEGLREVIDEWLVYVKKSGKFNFLYNRYFNNKNSVPHHKSKYSVIKKGGISPFDDILKKESEILGWDWRFLAALIYRESHFNPDAESPLGAYGLMQVTAETAGMFGVSDYFLPDSNIYAGVRYLKYLNTIFSEYPIDSLEKEKFTLASYNTGPGHVLDAMRLAEKHGKNPYLWEDNVDYFLRNKYKPEFYRDPVVRNGYCRGEETFAYVRNVLETYNNYKNINP